MIVGDVTTMNCVVAPLVTTMVINDLVAAEGYVDNFNGLQRLVIVLC